VVVDEGRGPLHVVVSDVVAAAAWMVQCGVDVAGVPQHDGIDDQPKCADRIAELVAYRAGGCRR
jgi:hypothetical protein